MRYVQPTPHSILPAGLYGWTASQSNLWKLSLRKKQSTSIWRRANKSTRQLSVSMKAAHIHTWNLSATFCRCTIKPNPKVVINLISWPLGSRSWSKLAKLLISLRLKLSPRRSCSQSSRNKLMNRSTTLLMLCNWHLQARLRLRNCRCILKLRRRRLKKRRRRNILSRPQQQLLCYRATRSCWVIGKFPLKEEWWLFSGVSATSRKKTEMASGW